MPPRSVNSQPAEQAAIDQDLARELATIKEQLLSLTAARAPAATEIALLREQVLALTAARAPVIADIKEDGEGEKPPEVLSVMKLYGTIPAKEILSIWKGKFEPLNLMRLSPELQDVEIKPMSNEEGILWDAVLSKIKIGAPSGNMRDFGDTPTKWAICFARYSKICHHLFGDKHPSLLVAMNQFQEEIWTLSTTYSWRSVLHAALSVHQSAIHSGQINTSAWVISSAVKDGFLRNPLKRQVTDVTSVASKKKQTPSPPCIKYNSADGCSYRGCRYKHVCSTCDGGHSKLVCRQ